MSELGKPYQKNPKKKQRIRVKMPHVNEKPLAGKKNLFHTQKIRPRMNYERIGKTIKKKINKKTKKQLKSK